MVACGSLPGVTIAFRPRNHPGRQDQDQPHFTEEETELSGSPVPGALCTHSQRQERPRKRPPLTKAGGPRASGRTGRGEGVSRPGRRAARARPAGLGCLGSWGAGSSSQDGIGPGLLTAAGRVKGR